MNRKTWRVLENAYREASLVAPRTLSCDVSSHVQARGGLDSRVLSLAGGVGDREPRFTSASRCVETETASPALENVDRDILGCASTRIFEVVVASGHRGAGDRCSVASSGIQGVVAMEVAAAWKTELHLRSPGANPAHGNVKLPVMWSLDDRNRAAGCLGLVCFT